MTRRSNVGSSGSSASTPNGLRRPATGACCTGPGQNTSATYSATMQEPETQARGRHLFEGTRPSGNSRISKVPTSPTAGPQSGNARAPTTGAPGRDPGRTACVQTRYPSKKKPRRPQHSPTTSSSHPIAWVGRRLARRKPTRAKAKNAVWNRMTPNGLSLSGVGMTSGFRTIMIWMTTVATRVRTAIAKATTAKTRSVR